MEAITHLGAVAYQEGRVDEALAKVEEALRIDPGYIHAHWDRTQYLFYGKRDFPGVVKAGEAFLRVLPKGADADNVRRLMGEARAQDLAKPLRATRLGRELLTVWRRRATGRCAPFDRDRVTPRRSIVFDLCRTAFGLHRTRSKR